MFKVYLKIVVFNAIEANASNMIPSPKFTEAAFKCKLNRKRNIKM